MASPILPLINGKTYEFADISIIMLGVPIIGATAIEYDEKPNAENIWGTGRHPIARGHGHVVPSAKITLLMAEVLNLMTANGLGRIYEIPEFDIIVTFTDDSLIPVTHKIRNCRFNSQGVTAATGETSIPIELELIISHIDWV